MLASINIIYLISIRLETSFIGFTFRFPINIVADRR